MTSLKIDVTLLRYYIYVFERGCSHMRYIYISPINVNLHKVHHNMINTESYQVLSTKRVRFSPTELLKNQNYFVTVQINQ